MFYLHKQIEHYYHLKYHRVIKQVCETVAITRFSKFNNTLFSSVGNDIGTRTGTLPVNCETIDFSNVTDAADGGSVKRILEYIFGGISSSDVGEIIRHDKTIRIILTSINSSVDYTDITTLGENIDPAVLARMTFINGV